jgi:hypothetical protein
VKLPVADPPFPIERASHLEPMPTRAIGNDCRIVFARARNAGTLPFELGILLPGGGIPQGRTSAGQGLLA